MNIIKSVPISTFRYNITLDFIYKQNEKEKTDME